MKRIKKIILPMLYGVLFGVFLIGLTVSLSDLFGCPRDVSAAVFTYNRSNPSPTPMVTGAVQSVRITTNNGFSVKGTPTPTPTPSPSPTPRPQHVFVNSDVPRYVSLTVPVIKYNEGSSKEYSTQPVHVDVDSLMRVYHADYDKPDWDTNNQFRTINTLWHFLVEQQCVSRTIASGIIGNVCMEGTFGRAQSTHEIFQNIDDVRAVLGKGAKGYGIAQWTWYTRQLNLLKYYEWANSQVDDWETVMVVAECCMLLEEIKSYKIFSDLGLDYDIEDATGRIASKYEKYRNHEKQWDNYNGVYYLETSSTSCTGYKRLRYAYNIYDYFLEN